MHSRESLWQWLVMIDMWNCQWCRTKLIPASGATSRRYWSFLFLSNSVVELLELSWQWKNYSQLFVSIAPELTNAFQLNDQMSTSYMTWSWQKYVYFMSIGTQVPLYCAEGQNRQVPSWSSMNHDLPSWGIGCLFMEHWLQGVRHQRVHSLLCCDNSQCWRGAKIWS